MTITASIAPKMRATAEDRLDNMRTRILVGVEHSRPAYNEMVRACDENTNILTLVFDARAGGDQTRFHIRVVTFSRMFSVDPTAPPVWQYSGTTVIPMPEPFGSRRSSVGPSAHPFE